MRTAYREGIAWNLVRTDGPVLAAVSVADLKTHLRETLVDITNDELIEQQGLAAEEAIEDELSAALLTQQWMLRLDCFPTWEIPLPRPPLSSVSSVQYLDADGVLQTLGPTVYTVDTYSHPGRIHLAYNQVWPVTQDVPNAVTVTYSAGRATAEEVPPMIRSAIKLAVGDLYENRERSAEQAVQELSIYERLMAQHRCMKEFVYR